MQQTRGVRQEEREKAKRAPKNRLKDARQCVVLRNGVAELEWALFTNDILPMCNDEVRKANDLWNAEYFKQDVFEVDSEKKTQAEAICDWCNQGYTLAQAKQWWEQNTWTRCAGQTSTSFDKFKRRRMDEIMTDRGFG